MTKPMLKPARFLLSAAVLLAMFVPEERVARAAPESTPQSRLAMMDDMMGGMSSGRMGQGGGMGGMSSGRMGGMEGTSGGMRRPEMGGSMGQTGGSSGGMGCCTGEMGMMGMAPGAGTPMAMPSALPGFPGASHIYHVGATGFFLDYAGKLNFTVEQTTALNTVKQQALTEQSAAQRKIDEAEQAFWTITAADQPDAAAIEAKLREIEKLRSDMRLAFIRAVGEAAKALTADQRKMVLGLAPMSGSAPSQPAAK